MGRLQSVAGLLAVNWETGRMKRFLALGAVAISLVLPAFGQSHGCLRRSSGPASHRSSHRRCPPYDLTRCNPHRHCQARHLRDAQHALQHGHRPPAGPGHQRCCGLDRVRVPRHRRDLWRLSRGQARCLRRAAGARERAPQPLPRAHASRQYLRNPPRHIDPTRMRPGPSSPATTIPAQPT